MAPAVQPPIQPQSLEFISAMDQSTTCMDSPSQHIVMEHTCAESMEEPMSARIERLGRERPAVFKTFWSEVIFVFSISMSQLLTDFFVSGFTVILPTLIRELDIPQASSVWSHAHGFIVSATNDTIDRVAGTRSLTLVVRHPGIIWTGARPVSSRLALLMNVSRV